MSTVQFKPFGHWNPKDSSTASDCNNSGVNFAFTIDLNDKTRLVDSRQNQTCQPTSPLNMNILLFSHYFLVRPLISLENKSRLNCAKTRRSRGFVLTKRRCDTKHFGIKVSVRNRSRYEVLSTYSENVRDLATPRRTIESASQLLSRVNQPCPIEQRNKDGKTL